MAKVKAPFLSLGATGTVSGALTVSRHRGLHVAKEIPSHPDAATLPQRYQRWRYYDSVQHWYTLSPAQRDAYRSLGSAIGLTAYQYHMRVYLRNPIDQVLWLRLDEQTGALAHDFSAKANHGTIFGALPVPGMIAGARWFDAVNDFIDCGNDSTLDLTDELTITLWLYRDGDSVYHRVLSKLGPASEAYDIYVDPEPVNTINIQGYGPGGPGAAVADTPIPLNSWCHVAISFDGADFRWYRNGLPDGTTARPGAFTVDPTDLYIGASQNYAHTWPGVEDDVRIYDRVLTPAHILAISRQRGP